MKRTFLTKDVKVTMTINNAEFLNKIMFKNLNK